MPISKFVTIQVNCRLSQCHRITSPLLLHTKIKSDKTDNIAAANASPISSITCDPVFATNLDAIKPGRFVMGFCSLSLISSDSLNLGIDGSVCIIIFYNTVALSIFAFFKLIVIGFNGLSKAVFTLVVLFVQ